MNVAHPGAFHHRGLIQRYGLFDARCKICGDYEFLLRAKIDLKAVFIDKTTVNMRVGGVSDNGFLALRKMRRLKLLREPEASCKASLK